RLDEAWKTTLLNQFHDILPGSSINKVYKDSDIDYAKTFGYTDEATSGALKAISKKVKTKGPGKALLLFNPLAWTRDDIVEVPVDNPAVTVLDPAGKTVPSQIVKEKDGAKLLFVAKAVPAMGYALYRIVPGAPKASFSGGPKASGATIENEFIKVSVDPKTGNISSMFDKKTKKEFFGPGKQGDMLQCYRDRHPNYDAWNIQLHEEIPTTLDSAPELVENGPVRATLKWTKKVGNSTFVHYLSVVRGVPMALGKLDVDWKEAHVMAKLAFDLNLKSDDAWYEIPYAAIKRAAVAKNDADRGKWEVSAQKWVDYPDDSGKFGFSLLNNSKYGYDTKGTVMRMSLLRSPKDPDPEADMKEHVIEYAMYPHSGDWRAAATPRKGFEFNTHVIPVFEAVHDGPLPASKSFFASQPSNVILASVKVAEDSKALILRVYEAAGKDSSAVITLPAKPKAVQETNLMEEQPVKVKAAGNEIKTPIGHYEIKTFKVDF
ncbi:MAG TPA: glycoside hydrolase family 38 C-terminal domain-containing protein, partial [bacterium]|nr:glycoside hydrolase family 38 C-terminal domain-containing protein [bacterium]